MKIVIHPDFMQTADFNQAATPTFRTRRRAAV